MNDKYGRKPEKITALKMDGNYTAKQRNAFYRGARDTR